MYGKMDCELFIMCTIFFPSFVVRVVLVVKQSVIMSRG